MKIWERYFLKQTLKTFFLILFCFYALYFLIDSASRSANNSHSHFHLTALLKHYLLEFVQHIDVLLPFALLIATVRTLTQLNMQNELVALLASGVKTKAILRPFLLLGFIGVSLIYVNSQFAIPQVLKEIRHAHDVRAIAKNKKKRKMLVQSLTLKDNTTLLFLDFNPQEEKFFDAYWIRSFDEIYHMKYLSPKTTPPVGYYVDHLSRDASGRMKQIGSFESKIFPEIKFNKKILLDTVTPPEELSLSKLWQKLPERKTPLSEKESELATTFYQKLAFPWLCLLAVLGPAPICIRFSRNFPVFFIYGLSIFGLAACYIIINASAVLGSRQVIAPIWAIGAPFILFFSIALFRFLKLR